MARPLRLSQRSFYETPAFARTSARMYSDDRSYRMTWSRTGSSTRRLVALVRHICSCIAPSYSTTCPFIQLLGSRCLWRKHKPRVYPRCVKWMSDSGSFRTRVHTTRDCFVARLYHWMEQKGPLTQCPSSRRIWSSGSCK